MCRKSEFRTIREIQNEDEIATGRVRKKRDRNTYFCLKYSRYFTTPVHAIITKWRKHFGLTWLLVKMSYSRFTNLGEKIVSDLKRKITEKVDLKSMDFIARRCNCPGSSRGHCDYDGVGCRTSMVVYKVRCLYPECGHSYIDQTSQHLKTKMSQHFQDTRRRVLFGENSDTFAKHFGQHFAETQRDPSPKNQRKLMSFEILREIDPISAMRSFGKLDCRLCMLERLTILNAIRNGEKIANTRSKIYGGCRHKKRFHAFFTSKDTDEPLDGEKSK